MKCTNCKESFTCSCKKRLASNGTMCCQSCIASYENSLTSNKVLLNAATPVNVKTSGSITK